MTAKLRPERLIGLSVVCLMWEVDRESFWSKEAFSKAWRQDSFRNRGGKLAQWQEMAVERKDGTI